MTVYEVSWEVGHKVGGIHTVVATKARSAVARRGDGYVAVGPWLLSEGNADKVLDAEPRFAQFEAGCRAAGLPVRVGRWRIPGRPLAVLVEFSVLYARKDEILESLWKSQKVDSLRGGWDYVEPVLFGHAAGMVVERWQREIGKGPAVAQFHEWMAAAGLLYLKASSPEVGTVFTAHATVLGRSLAATGVEPIAGLAGRAPAAVADELGAGGKHSLEGAASRAADVLTTVSEMTAREVEAFHGRRPDPLLPNGLDVDALVAAAGETPAAGVYERLVRLASKFTGQDLGGARLVCVAGRAEFRNKGFDLVLAAAAELAKRSGPPVVVFLFVPGNHAGVRHRFAKRLAGDAPGEGPIGVVTHHLTDAAADPIVKRCAELGLGNAPGSRVKIVYVPAYLHGDDGAVNLRYEAVVRAADLTAFPSFYDAWGYTPQESLALGVPTITSDCAGFGLWAQAEGLGASDGVHLLARRGRTFEECRDALAALIEAALAAPKSPELGERCREVARRTDWSKFGDRYEAAYAAASAAAALRPLAPARAAPRAEALAAPRPARPTVRTIDVANALPSELAGLARLASNWLFAWDPGIASLFEDIDPAAWAALRGNPVRLLREAPPESLAGRARDPGYLRRLGAALARFDAYLADAPKPTGRLSAKHPVAYVCAEYGIHECLPIYSGGLGVLAGDHLRAASDLGLPLVAVGLLYRKGYMRQRLADGADQIALVDAIDPRLLPLTLVAAEDGRPLEVELHLPGTSIRLQAWRADVGRVPLYLLDSDIDANRPEDRPLTHSLYGGDAEYRVRQEIVLGRGGVKLLARLGIEPAVHHVNEGHGAFAALERTAELMRLASLTFDEAREAARAATVFTTHTPVPAGHDVFDQDLMRRYFSNATEWLGLGWDAFFALGESNEGPGFNMTSLALRFGAFVNGVSVKHGEVSRQLLRAACPHLAVEEMPIASVTNGVHLSAWTSPEIASLLGAEDGRVCAADFARAAGVSDEALWAARTRLRRALVERVAAGLRASFAERHDSVALLERLLAGLVPDALYVGFARRFATYKRADLVLSDPGRLRALLDGGSGGPVRLLVAGKAHPKDRAARELLAKVGRIARTDEFAGRLLVLENYDIALARALVQGVDVWLNNPRRPLEASGTSGMKAAANGVLNLSVGDGWWLEARNGRNGWVIGDDGAGAPPEVEDETDAASLYRILERDVVPLYHRRDAAGLPREWLARVRESLVTIPPVFDTARMVREYRDRAYLPLAERFAQLWAAGGASLREAAANRARVRKGLAAVRLPSVEVGAQSVVATEIPVAADVDLGALDVSDVVVEFVAGRRAGDELSNVTVVPLRASSPGRGVRRFTGTFRAQAPGALGWFVRVRPAGPPALDEPATWS